MKDMRSVRFNEKVKRISTLTGGGGLTLILTAMIRWSDSGATFSTAAWILTGIMLILMSVHMNELIESEEIE